jgi:hypothetical protein
VDPVVLEFDGLTFTLFDEVSDLFFSHIESLKRVTLTSYPYTRLYHSSSSLTTQKEKRQAHTLALSCISGPYFLSSYFRALSSPEN